MMMDLGRAIDAAEHASRIVDVGQMVNVFDASGDIQRVQVTRVKGGSFYAGLMRFDVRHVTCIDCDGKRLCGRTLLARFRTPDEAYEARVYF